MSSRDFIIRGGSVVTAEQIQVADIRVSEGRFAEIAPQIRESVASEIDARGQYVFPGILDAHVHFNEPGRTDWEGLATGSAALAAGGGTWFADMPLNSLPPVLDAASFAEKRRLAVQKSVTDFSLWGGLVPENLDKLAELRDCGAVALKAFMCFSGVREFSGVTDAGTLHRGMKRAAELGLLVGVHAEDDALAAKFTEQQQAKGRDARAYLRSRPVEVELAAIRTAIEMAGETGCALHIVHVSSAEGIALVSAAKRQGVNVTAETCPHYLLLNEGATIVQGAPAKCAPPLRPEASRLRLWQATRGGGVDTIGSDHSPAPPSLKTSDNFFAIWGGISGCQHGFQLLLSEAMKDGVGAERALPLLARLLAANVAKRFKLPGKGAIAVGHDADFSVLALEDDEFRLENADLLYRHQQGPYQGRKCAVRIERTVVRGRPVWGEGKIASEGGGGQFIGQTSAPHA